MGNKCVQCHRQQVRKVPQHASLPHDIQSFRRQNLSYSLPKIMFQGQIFNIQLINCPIGAFSLNFQITDVISIMLPEKQVIAAKKAEQATKQISWKLHEKFGFGMNEYELRTHFLVIEVYGTKKTKIDQILVNLYMIATGPQHHDLEVKMGNNKFSRLKFDFKISQVVEINISIDQIKVQFDQDFEGQQFDYSFKIIRNNEVISFSESSHPKIIKSPEQKNIYRELTLDDECKSPLKFRRSTSNNKMIKRDLKSFIEWGEGDKKDSKLMSIGAKLLSNDINKAYFYFLIWKFSKIQGAQQKNKDDWNLFAGVLINFSKLFDKPYEERKLVVSGVTEDSSIENEKIGFDVQQRQISIEQQLWGQDGNSSIGKCMIKLQMKNPKFQKQLQACARTQDGIVNMTFLFKSYVGKNARLSTGKISKVSSKYEEIQDLFRRLTGLPSDSYSNRSQILMLEQEIYQGFKEILQTIKQSLPQSLIVLSSPNADQVKELIEDQLQMIELMNKLYYIISDNTVYAGLCWEIVLMIMKRGEFYLQNIGFMGFDKANIPLFERKLNSARKYQVVMYKYFLLAIRSQTSSSIRNSLTSSTEAFKAYCYIKIPPFRQKIIESIQKVYDQDVIEFKLQQLQSITSDMSSLLKSQRPMLNLNWDKYFHDQIRENTAQENEKLQKQVLEEIQNSKWIEEVSKREDAFFTFTAQMVKRLNQLTMRVKTWKWNYFPGYTKIVRGFLVEMKKRKIMDYPQIMIKTTAQLLANQELVNIFMPIIFEKTNSFSKSQVIRCLSMMQSFFNCLSQNQTKLLPRTFNYLYFFKSFKLIIETIEHTEAIVKALIIIYQFYEWLSPEWRDNITMYLLGKVFFKLFFHWSFQIRIIFYNFLIIKIKYIRIQQMSKLPSNTQSMLMNTKIDERYEEISTILMNAQNQKKQQILDYRLIYEKDLYKKMRNKMRRKKQSKDGRGNLTQNGNLLKLKRIERQEGEDFAKKEINSPHIIPSLSHYTLSHLLNNRPSVRKQSFNQDEMRNRSSTYFITQKLSSTNNPYVDEPKQEPLQITRGSSFCIDVSSMQNPRKLSTDVNFEGDDQDITSLGQLMDSRVVKKGEQNVKGSQRMGRLGKQLKAIQNKKLNYNIYNRQDHQLTEISPTEINYISKGIDEYRDTLNEINKYYQKRGQLPKRQLQIEPFLSDQV